MPKSCNTTNHGKKQQSFKFLLIPPLHSNLLTIFQFNISWFCIITRMLLHYAKISFTFPPIYSFQTLFLSLILCLLVDIYVWKLKSSKKDDRWKKFLFILFVFFPCPLLSPISTWTEEGIQKCFQIRSRKYETKS